MHVESQLWPRVPAPTGYGVSPFAMAQSISEGDQSATASPILTKLFAKPKDFTSPQPVT
jgi:hypothetical protein